MLESLNAYTCIFAFLNLLILYLVLKKVLFKPIMQVMEKRRTEIQNSLDASEQARKQADELKKDYEAHLADARIDGQKVIDDMTTRANRIYAETIRQAEKDRDDILLKAREQAEREHEQMIRNSRTEITGLALSAASKVMEKNMDNESNRKLVEQFLDDTGAA